MNHHDSPHLSGRHFLRGTIALTALAAMIGAFFIVDDPIFSGLAVSLIFGILVSTVLTLVVIPVLYYAANRKRFADAAFNLEAL